MAVKNERLRYIGFVLQGSRTDRRNMINAIRRSFQDEYDEIKPWLTVFDGKKGIIRCRHFGKERTIEILNSIDICGGKVKTLISSGTIKKVKKRLFDDE